MKHVFVIHSHTVFLTSMGIIKLLGIPHDDIVFLYARNYSQSVIDVTFKCIDISYLYNIPIDTNGHTFSYRYWIKRIDEIIEKEINDIFDLYIPHLMNYLNMILYTNKKCKQASYIQEAGMAFFNTYYTHVSWRDKIRNYKHQFFARTKRIWFYGKMYVDGTMNKQETLFSYALNDRYFKYLPSVNRIIKWPIVNIDIFIEKNSQIFIVDGWVNNKMTEPLLFYTNMERLIKTYSREKNYVKFHPNQSLEERELILSYFIKYNHKYELLDDSVPFEFVIICKQNLNLVGFGSSLLYFAKDMGHNVICHDEWFLISPMYQNYMHSRGVVLFNDYYEKRDEI